MKIVTIIGARPQFIKAAALSREIAKHKDINEIIVHTGQHFDANMSEIFFEQMEIPKPGYNLEIQGLTHGAMTGRMIEGIEAILLKEKPDFVLVYGDTNSTLAGALAAQKLGIKIVHIEAGLRSFNMKMPEEVNRILTDRISDYLFCPTETAIKNLHIEAFESFGNKIIMSGDIMLDAALFYASKAKKPEGFGLNENFVLATIHRQENTDDDCRLRSIFQAFNLISSDMQVIVPLHPRTAKKLAEYKIQLNPKVQIIDPVGYFEMIYLIQNSQIVMTDSGGLQKEAYFFKKPCITLRDETEWIELVENGYNILTGANLEKITNAVEIVNSRNLKFDENLYGNGNTAAIIIEHLIKL